MDEQAEREEREATGVRLRNELSNTERELSARLQRLGSIDREQADIRTKLERLRPGPSVRFDASELMSQEALRRNLRAKFEEAQRRRATALEEVERARERKRLIEADLEGLGVRAELETNS